MNKTLLQSTLGAAGVASLTAGFCCDQWLLGGAGAAVSACLLGLNSPLSGLAFSPQPAKPAVRRRAVVDSPSSLGNDRSAAGLVDRMIWQGRSALLLRKQIADDLAPEEVHSAWRRLHDSMALTPAARVEVEDWQVAAGLTPPGTAEPTQVEVDCYWIDRTPVTNADYLRFVESGGYEQQALWDQEILSLLRGFVDVDGRPGPRYWEDGGFPEDEALHPVVGVSWYEARAYARWAGKRLATDAEWLRSAVWPVPSSGRITQRRFPWGDAMVPEACRLWSQDALGTAPVDSCPLGDNPLGVRHLVGNVWEWMADDFGRWSSKASGLESLETLISIRGGAFDTYFERQANPQFTSGEVPMARKPNIGFRCVLSASDLIDPPEDL